MDTKTQDSKKKPTTNNDKHCGIIMPIAPMDGYSAEHWLDVKNIITEATKQVDGMSFRTEIVSNSSGEIDIIHKRIIQNLYNADIVICDISGRNPNVMFELGMRLTFDKPTIIIKDDKTDFIFDTGVIEHLIYPKDLRFKKIVEFQKELAKRIKKTYEISQNDTTYSTFLGNFGEFKVPTLKQETITDVNQAILDELTNLRQEMNYVKREVAASSTLDFSSTHSSIHAQLKFGITNYFDSTDDRRSPIDIYKDNHFFDFMINVHDINIHNLDMAFVLNTIADTQKN